MSGQRYSFTGHQTFTFDFGWLPKGVNALAQQSDFFRREDASIVLGVGKNMVASIKYWLQATGLAQVERNVGAPTELGKLMFQTNEANTPPPYTNVYGSVSSERLENEPLDPYLEDPRTLWVLHWQLASRPRPASACHLLFTRWRSGSFTRDSLVDWLLERAADTARTASRKTILKDVDVLLRTYSPRIASRNNQKEDRLTIRPLADLSLLRTKSPNVYEVPRKIQPSLTPGIFAYALANYFENFSSGRSVTLEQVVYEDDSPGTVFRLLESEAVRLLEHMPSQTGFRYDETSGQRLVFRTERVAPLDLLRQNFAAER